jgi:integrase
MKNERMASLVKAYLEERRCLGFSLDIAGSQLTAFARFTDGAGHRGPLTMDIIIKWIESTSEVSPMTRARRVEVIRPFAKYCARIDPASQIPDRDLFGRAHRRLAPHIFTDREIQDLLAAASRLPPTNSLRSLTYATFFGLIAAAGLRFSEAFNLRCKDFDSGRALLTVCKTKFRKDRLVPLHPTAVEALNRYVALRHRKLGSATQQWLFVTDTGQRPAERTVHGVFERLRKRLGWKARGGHPAPRIHDLRHTFVCRRLKLWQENGPEIDNAVPALSTYLGHAKVSDTYWYLTATPDLMSAAVKRFERFARVKESRHA